MLNQGEKSAARQKQVSLIVGTVTTFLSLVPTTYAAIISNSVTLFADLLRCLAEFGAIFLSLLIVLRVSRGDRSRFNFGFGKLEQLSSLVVGISMLGTFLVLVFTSLHRFWDPQIVTNVGFGLVLAVFSVAGNIAMWIHNLRLSRKQQSPVLDAQWRLFRAKAGASVVVLVALGSAVLAPRSDFTLYADPVGSLLLSGFILYSAIGLLSTSMRDLLDCSVDEAAQLSILKVLVKHEAHYRGLQSIRTRSGGGKISIEIYLEFDPSSTLAEIAPKIESIKGDLILGLPGSEITVVPVPLGS